MKYHHEKRLSIIAREIINEAAINSTFSNNTHDIDYSKLWQLLYDNRILKIEIGLLDNFYQHNWNEQLLFLICRFYLVNKIQFIPSIKWACKEPFQTNILTLNLHFGISPLAYYAHQQAAMYCVVSDYPKAVKISFGLIGLYSSTPKIINRDQKVFMRIKEALNSNYLVSCAIDYRDQINGNFNSISPNIFKFILKYKIDSQSIAYRVLDNGQIDLVPIFLNGEEESNLINQFFEGQRLVRPHIKFKLKEFNLNDQRTIITSHFNSI